MDCRLILDGPADGAWNMAVDEAMLLSAGGAGQGATLRLYQWDQPTLSLGYFQRHEDRSCHESSIRCPLVRRSTGGGAILHDRELTYSYTVPAESHLGLDLRDYYGIFHETLFEQLAELGVPTRLCAAPGKRKASEEPFLCFQRRSEGDILSGQVKICGSAQRRHRGALLQHGSILLETSMAAPELAGIFNLAGISIKAMHLGEQWTDRLGDRLGHRFHRAGLKEAELEVAEHLRCTKFASIDWTERR